MSTLPTQYGEKVVMRLLEKSAPMISFAGLGFPPAVAERLEQLISLPQGMLLVTGPTGSGKSTTLYSILNLLRKPAVNIVTVEDPVEYALPGVNQVHVNARAGLTFASCLRSILRQDPNVIMIGEIRDLETAEIAMKSAQTGHLVLSTIHTNDSISAVARLLDLGIPQYLIASSVSGILSQRLLRKLCTCAKPAKVTPEYAERLLALGWLQPPDSLPSAQGCDVCDRTGYKGRIGVYELLWIDDTVRAILREDYKPELVRTVARAAGMRRLHEDALDKLKAGITTLEEILRVVPVESGASSGCDRCGRELSASYRFCPNCGSRRSNAGTLDSEVAVRNGIREGVLS